MNSVKPQATVLPRVNRSFRPVSSWLFGCLMVTAMSLSGCNKAADGPQDTNTQVTNDKITKTTDTQKQDLTKQPATSDTSANEPEIVSGEAAGAPGNPVQYNVAAWNDKKVTRLKIDNLEAIQSGLGKVVSTDDNSLDYASNPATKYRFMADDAAYLDLIDSQKYLELGWYYANPTDSDAEKDTSINHAKKAYQFARELMGDDGGKIVADMLGGQIIKNTTAGDYRVELAKCEFYSCMLVLAK